MGSKWERWVTQEPTSKLEKWTGAWYKEMALVCVIFGITGSTAMWGVRPLLYEHAMGIPKETPKEEITGGQRALGLALMTPFYYVILMGVGTVFGRYQYVKKMALKPIRMLMRRKQ